MVKNKKGHTCLIWQMNKHTIKHKVELDGCFVWNAQNTVLSSKRLAICATV